MRFSRAKLSVGSKGDSSGDRVISATVAYWQIRAEMKDIVNTKIKFREPFRPFAPSVLVEKAGGVF